MPTNASKKNTAPKPSEKLPESPYLMYKQKPLLQCGDTIYYGSMTEDYVVMMQVLDRTTLTPEVEGATALSLPDHLVVKLIHTDVTLSPLDQIVKTAEKQGLYPALDLASVWLQEALKEQPSA